MKDYAKTVEGLKALKVDVAAIEQNATTGLQGAQALVQQAEAEGEAEEGDAEEGEEE